MTLYNPASQQQYTAALPQLGNTAPPVLGRDYTANQFDATKYANPANQAYNILLTTCGPELAMTFARYLGKSLTPDNALQIAEQYGYWTRGGEFQGPQNMKKFLDVLGIPSEYSPEVNWNYLAEQVSRGTAIAGVSTPGHYFALQGFNASTGEFDTGNSGTAYRGGKRFLTPGQIANIGGGPQGSFVVRGNGQGAANVPSNDYENPWANRAAEIARGQGLDPDIFIRLVRQESGFNPSATSPSGAQGLTQLMPGTARGLGVRNAFDPEENLQAGATYLASLLKQFGGDYRLALAAYNAGPGAVQQYNGVPPYQETRNYLERILGSGVPGSTVPSPTRYLSSPQQAQPKVPSGLYGAGSIFPQLGGSVTPPLFGYLHG